MKVLCWIIKVLFGWSMWFVFRTRKRYVDKKATKLKGGAVIISNHSTVLDGMLLVYCFPFNSVWSLTGEVCYDRSPIITFFLKLFMAIRVDRDGHNLAFMAEAVDKLKKGDSVLIFPQSRLPHPGETTTPPFLPTFILLAKSAGKPIVPVWHSEHIDHHRTLVSIGKPIYLDDVDTSSFENVKALAASIQKDLYALADLHQDKKQHEAQEDKPEGIQP